MAHDTKKSHPQLPSNVWWSVRRRFLQSIPAEVTSTYLASILNVDPRAADVYLRELKGLGLVADDGRPTDLAKRWRDDAKYAEVCKEIRENVYPAELLSVAPPPTPNRDSAVKWFMHAAGLGQGAANNKSSLYLLLATADPAVENAPRGDRSGDSRRARAQTSTRSSAKSIRENDIVNTTVDGAKGSVAPDIHLNFQIHISPQTTADQIEAIFAAMAKHLRIAAS